jgi:hypothetical protein
MTFQLCAKPQNLFALKGLLEEGVKCVQNSKPHRYAAPQSTRVRHVPLDPAGKGEWLDLHRVKEMTRRLLRHHSSLHSPGARNGHKVIHLQRDAEAIKPRAEIRCGGRNAYCDLLLVQRMSPKNAERRAGAAAKIVAWGVPAARRWRERQ